MTRHEKEVRRRALMGGLLAGPAAGAVIIGAAPLEPTAAAVVMAVTTGWTLAHAWMLERDDDDA